MDKARDRLQWTKSLHSAFVCINYLSADCPTIPISSGLPRFCLKISNLDQYMIGIGKISILTSLPEHQILSVISWNWYSKNYRSCQKYNKKSSTRTRSHAKGQSHKGVCRKGQPSGWSFLNPWSSRTRGTDLPVRVAFSELSSKYRKTSFSVLVRLEVRPSISIYITVPNIPIIQHWKQA